MSFFYFYLLILVHPYLADGGGRGFPKAGRESWEALIPGYNYFIVFKMTSNKPWWSLLLIFPGVHLVMWMGGKCELHSSLWLFLFYRHLTRNLFPVFDYGENRPFRNDFWK